MDATIGFENSVTLAGGEWAKLEALGYRQPLPPGFGMPGGNLVSAESFSNTITPFKGLHTNEIEVLRTIYTQCGGEQWEYSPGTDVFGKGNAWFKGGSDFHHHPDPCSEGWFGIKCDTKGENIIGLFPNTRHSGNPLRDCEMPVTISHLSK